MTEKSEKYKQSEKESTDNIVVLVMAIFTLLGWEISSTMLGIFNISQFFIIPFMAIFFMFCIWCVRFINKNKVLDNIEQKNDIEK